MKTSKDIEVFAKNVLKIYLRDDQGEFIFFDLQQSTANITIISKYTRRWGLTTCLLTYALSHAYHHKTNVWYILPSYAMIKSTLLNLYTKTQLTQSQKNEIRLSTGGIVKFGLRENSELFSFYDNGIYIFDEVELNIDDYSNIRRTMSAGKNKIIYALPEEMTYRDSIFTSWRNEAPVNSKIHTVEVGEI